MRQDLTYENQTTHVDGATSILNFNVSEQHLKGVTNPRIPDYTATREANDDEIIATAEQDIRIFLEL
jgi:hypothetical protein